MYETNREWADGYTSKVLAILNKLISHLAVLSIASDEKDKKYATDLEIKLLGGTVAVRLRRPSCGFRELTIRAYTELPKIKAGYAYRYFYGWTNKEGDIIEWILVDLDKLRLTDLLDKPSSEWGDNHDGTYFLPITIKELRNTGCLIKASFSRLTMIRLGLLESA